MSIGFGVLGHAQLGAATFSNVGALELINTGGLISDVDFSIDLVQAQGSVPAPGSLALVSLSLLGLWAARRRKAFE